MKVSELKIGNYATIDNPTAWSEMKGVPLVVVGTELEMGVNFPESTGSVELRTLDRLKYFHQFDEFIQPIPLTEEWLLKFGFEDETKPWYTEKYFQHREFNQWGFWFSDMAIYRNMETYIAEVKYVHSLQNLFHSLTGEELTIKEP